MDPFIYHLPVVLSHKKLQKKLPKTPPYKLSLEKGEKWEGVLFDTFDAEMFHSAKMLFQVRTKLYLCDLKSGQLIEQVSPEQWSFAGDLQDGPVSSLLKRVSCLRAFLPVATVHLCFEHGLLLDDEGKTRARFHNLTIGRGRKSVGVGSTQYLRGYAQAHTDLRQSLKEIGANSCQDVGLVYESLDIEQEQYTAKPFIQLNSDAPVKESAQVIVSAFIKTARRNEKGVVADYDTEFLHDYRVSLRKVRSVLSLLKGVYRQEDTVRLKQDFAALMQKTNTLRDLDVYLLNKENYFSMVPSDTHEGLEILFNYFAVARKKEQKSVSKVVRSKVYLKEISRLEKLFAEGSTIDSGPRSEEDSLAFACSVVLKRYAKVCKIARSINDKTEDEVIHELRINCKKLRYLMEFFSPLFPEDQIKMLIKSLKLLQDNLGNFNDYSVQQTFLRQVLSEKMTDFGGWELKVAESVGALTAMLNRLQLKERRQVMKNFARFDSFETREILKKLFHIEGNVHENNSLLQ
ncbi:MAG: CHAD domain-containing protein [Desulfobulbaceae bacterium]|nr:CHAD domain-containing protein [Desulfobulbaceae bacterium]